MMNEKLFNRLDVWNMLTLANPTITFREIRSQQGPQNSHFLIFFGSLICYSNFADLLRQKLLIIFFIIILFSIEKGYFEILQHTFDEEQFGICEGYPFN